MNLSTVATLAGYKSHYTADGIKTLCGREVSNGTSGIDMCKACTKASDKLTATRDRLEYDTRAAETQDDVMQAAPRDAEGTTYVEGCEVESVSVSILCVARTFPTSGSKGRCRDCHRSVSRVALAANPITASAPAEILSHPLRTPRWQALHSQRAIPSASNINNGKYAGKV